LRGAMVFQKPVGKGVEEGPTTSISRQESNLNDQHIGAPSEPRRAS
jgi:hypothetical protein